MVSLVRRTVGSLVVAGLTVGALAGPAAASLPMAKLVKFGTFKAPVAVV